MFKNKEGKIRSGWKIAALSAVMLGTITIVSVLISIIPVIQLVSSGDYNPMTMEFSVQGKRVMDQINTVMLFLQEIIIILTTIIAWRFIIKRQLGNMGLPSFIKYSRDFFIGLLFGIVSMSIVFGAIVLSGNATVETWVPHFSSDTIIYLLLFILVGFAEEIYGRGFVMSTLRQTGSLPAIIIISAVIFAVMHSGNSGISLLAYLNLFLVGLLFAYMFLKSGNIWMPIGFHITWNYFQGNIFGFKVSGLNTSGIWTTVYDKNTILNGGDFGPEGGLFVTAIILMGFLFVRWYYRNSHFSFLQNQGNPG